MKIVATVAELRAEIKEFRTRNEHIAFVPTMGNLHAGHLKLVRTAKTESDRTVVSIFVNPTQFGQGEDYEIYPRTEQEDIDKLAASDVDLVFLPSVADMYSDDALTLVSVKELSDLYCGRSRPGHFNGVTTVVCKLFNIVQPDTAFFGQKDYQQLTIIRKMVADLNLPVSIKAVETLRESSGLAMSSRNGYLTPEELTRAPRLYQALRDARDKIRDTAIDFSRIEEDAIESLRVIGFQVDYFKICRSDNLRAANRNDSSLIVLAAAKLGKTRLIDNIVVTSTLS